MAPVSVGDRLSLTIEKPAAGGRMIARADRLVVLVSGAIPGERVLAEVERVGKGVVYASVREVQEPSPDRRRESADLLCGGCLYAHIDYGRQLDLKSAVIADAFARIGRIELPAPVAVVRSEESGYRMRARLHVRGRQVGFFREGTHDLCDARATRQLLPESCDVMEQLVQKMASTGLASTQALELSENVTASERVVHVDATSPLPVGELQRLGETEGVTGVSSVQGAHGSSHVHDTLTIDDQVLSLRRHVLAFFQGNRFLLNTLVAHVLDQAGGAGRVVDLYAGVGLFSVALAARGSQVTAVEGDRIAAADLQANATAVGEQLNAAHLSVEAFVGRSPLAADVVLVDPPRTGVSREALNGIIGMGSPRVVYVSCDVATLARDARRLVDAGYALTRIDAFDLFPNTPHVETVAVFQRD